MMPNDDVLVCEFGQRPKGAPSLFDVAPAIRRVSRETGSLVIDFDLAAAAVVRECTAAERLCCPTISWELDEGVTVQLRISTTPGRLRTLEEMFASARSEQLFSRIADVCSDTGIFLPA